MHSGTPHTDAGTSAAPVDTVTVELEDAGADGLLRSLFTTLTSQSGVRSHRFVARAEGAGPGQDAVVATSPTFPVPPLSVIRDHETPEDGWPDEVRDALGALDRDLTGQGWRRAGVGRRWYARRYTRETPER